MWVKPKNWGGYDTSGMIFFIFDKNGLEIAWENSEYWQEAYATWLDGKNKTYFGLGCRTINL